MSHPKLCWSTTTLLVCARAHVFVCSQVYNRGPKFNPDADLQYPVLWETSDVCNCVQKTLRFVSFVGFSGYHLEADFVKHLITKAFNMEKITIVCKCSKKELGFLVHLQDQKASSNLSIMVKIAKNKIPLIELNELFNNNWTIPSWQGT